jgi:hypothetical protein
MTQRTADLTSVLTLRRRGQGWNLPGMTMGLR